MTFLFENHILSNIFNIGPRTICFNFIIGNIMGIAHLLKMKAGYDCLHKVFFYNYKFHSNELIFGQPNTIYLYTILYIVVIFPPYFIIQCVTHKQIHWGYQWIKLYATGFPHSAEITIYGAIVQINFILTYILHIAFWVVIG